MCCVIIVGLDVDELPFPQCSLILVDSCLLVWTLLKQNQLPVNFLLPICRWHFDGCLLWQTKYTIHLTIITRDLNSLEYEKDRSLGFLDLRLHILDNIIQIDWFHKTTFSKRFLSYYSSYPLCHKVGTIFSLINRAFLLSHPRFHQKNIKFIIGLLLDNGYPLNLIFEKINDRIKIISIITKNILTILTKTTIIRITIRTIKK